MSVFLITIKLSYAFFSPSTLQLLSSSIGPILRQIIVAAITAIVAFSIKIRKKRTKKLIVAICSIILIVLLVIAGFRFNTLRKRDSQVLTLDELILLDVHELYYRNVTFGNYTKTNFIDLNNIDEETYNRFKKVFMVWPIGVSLKDSIYLDFSTVWNSLRNFEDEQLEEFLSSMGITKEDKILVVCNMGFTSTIFSYFLNERGYEAHLSSLEMVANEKLIKSSIIKKMNQENYVIIDELNPSNSDENYIIFFFGIDECIVLFDYKYGLLDLEDNLIVKERGVMLILQSPDTSLQTECNQQPSDFDEVYGEGSKIVCLTNLHCLLTQHHLYNLNLTKEIKIIYKMKGFTPSAYLEV